MSVTNKILSLTLGFALASGAVSAQDIDPVKRAELDSREKIANVQADATVKLAQIQADAIKSVEAARIAAEERKTAALVDVYSNTLAQMVSVASVLPPKDKAEMLGTILARLKNPATKESQEAANARNHLTTEALTLANGAANPAGTKVTCKRIGSDQLVMVCE